MRLTLAAMRLSPGPALRLLWVLTLLGPAAPNHAGLCPNAVSLNLWVDAQSTCERECRTDQDCAALEKCCTNVCGLLSCVASRSSDGSADEGQSGAGVPVGSCEQFQCGQQGAVCELWEGQPICRCQDRCDSAPGFTCASDGLTYFNRCFMDAEACLQGIELSEVTCRFQLPGPEPSPLPDYAPPPSTLPPSAPPPLPASAPPLPPTLYSNPQHQVVYQGGTASFHCDALGRPPPDLSWEKQGEAQERVLMRPDRIYGNVVITNLGQLVVYNAQLWDTGIYTCIARNSAGSLRADYPLSVVRRESEDYLDDPEASLPLGQPFSPADCLVPPERGECGEQRVDWFFDAERGSCYAFANGGCAGRNRFDTYEECRASCQHEGQGMCSLPAVQGPCVQWEHRWAYSAPLRRCHAFVYGGCHGNRNNFRSRSQCEASCPQPRRRPCRSCRPAGRMADSLCQSDFAIVGRLTELVEELDSGIARFHLEQVLRDEKMGLQLFKTQHLEVLLTRMDWSCPCPNITRQLQLPLLVMGEVRDGTALILPHSYVRPVSPRRLRRISDALGRKSCSSEELRETRAASQHDPD